MCLSLSIWPGIPRTLRSLSNNILNLSVVIIAVDLSVSICVAFEPFGLRVTVTYKQTMAFFSYMQNRVAFTVRAGIPADAASVETETVLPPCVSSSSSKCRQHRSMGSAWVRWIYGAFPGGAGTVRLYVLRCSVFILRCAGWMSIAENSLRASDRD